MTLVSPVAAVYASVWPLASFAGPTIGKPTPQRWQSRHARFEELKQLTGPRRAGSCR